MTELVDVRLWSDQGPSCVCEWPVGLPRNFDELFRTYGDFIAKKVASYNKVPRNMEDLYQEICCKLIGSDLLNKFVDRAARTLPDTFYAHEAAALMGLSFDEFQVALYYQGCMGLSKKPCEGEMTLDDETGRAILDPRALFAAGDIQALDEAYPDTEERPRPLQRQIVWPLQALGFKAYLTQAIHNHFANWCRTRSRKYKDILLPGTAVVTSTDTGYTHVGHNFEGTDWESRLVAMALNDEDLLSIVETVRSEFEAAGLDLHTVAEMETYEDEHGRTRQRPTARAVQGLELLDFVAEGRTQHPEPLRRPKAAHEITNFGDGKTIREGVKAQQRAEMRAKLRMSAG